MDGDTKLVALAPTGPALALGPEQIADARLRSRILALSAAQPFGGCWLWNGYIKPTGYGSIGVKDETGWRTQQAHRVSYEAFIGKVPQGADLDHLCRVRHCVNPMHLEPVTRSENLRRSPIMGRQEHKTHCPQGHPYSGTNSRGQRICRACANAAVRRFYHRQGESV